MKIVPLMGLIAFILLASFSLPTKAIAVDGSISKGNGESCVTRDLQDCYETVVRGMMSTECCDTLKDKQSCLCDVIKTSMLSGSVHIARIMSCGIPSPKC
ncbi:unnamed protein product [Arabis nemorensis]|uniref:Bifunctional inhibitor/plant lipid transfer protein/seed storage helical domain-containing protein n=1 Tax=Arabis nemorensis TaxID=586526 RepID=A0A565AVW5_9BRAS|nr:unnamed protein product [Arabis nemorensis]